MERLPAHAVTLLPVVGSTLARRPGMVAGLCGTLGLALLAFALRSLAWGQAGLALNALSLGFVVGVLALSGASFAAQVARWRLFVRAAGHNVPWRALVNYRLASWGINYVTPGVQVGGEILRIAALERFQEIPRRDAVMSVLLDKLVELATSVSILVGSLLLSGAAGLIAAGHGGLAVAAWAAMVAAPLGTVAAIARGNRPLSRLTAFVLRVMGALHAKPFTGFRTLRPLRTVARGERTVARLLDRSPGIAVRAFAVSGLYWALGFAEYFLICRVLGAKLSPLQVLAALAVTHVALQIAPVPGGVGALEASHVAVFAFFGSAPSVALLVAVLVRGRDALFAAVGLWCGARSVPKLWEDLPTEQVA